MKKISRNTLYALCTLSGTIIGVGLFSLPYITSQVGILVMIIYFLGIGALAIFIHSLFAEVALKTPDFLRIPGFAKFHLGKWGEGISFFTFTIGTFGAILAYLIIGGEFLSGLLTPIFGGSAITYTFIYFIIGAPVIYFGIRLISKIEFLGLVLFFVVMIVIFLKGLPNFEIGKLFFSNHHRDLFLPYGPIMFSLWGTALIPEVEEMLGKKKKLLKKIIPLAIIIPMIAYLSFIILVTGISGDLTSEESIVGLRMFLDGRVINFLLFFGLLTTFTSFIVLGLTLKKVFWYDFKIDKRLAWAITCFVPLALFLVVTKDFINVIAFVGGVTIGVDGILILLMHRKVKKKTPLFTYPLVLIFILGIAYQIIYFLR